MDLKLSFKRSKIMKISKALSILLLGTAIILFGCGDGDAAKGGNKGKPDPSQCDAELVVAQETIVQLEAELAQCSGADCTAVENDLVQCTNNLTQSTAEYNLCSQSLTQCNSDLVSTQSTLNQVEYNYTQCEDSLAQQIISLSDCNTNLNLCTDVVGECNTALTQCEGDLGACLNNCTAQYGSLGQFGVVELIVNYDTIVYLNTQMELDNACSAPGTIFGDIYDWGPNNPVNGVFDVSRAGVITGDCCRLDTKTCYILN